MQVGCHWILNHHHPLMLSADPAFFFSATASKFTMTMNPSLLRAAPTLPLSDIVMSHQCPPDLGQLVVKNALWYLQRFTSSMINIINDSTLKAYLSVCSQPSSVWKALPVSPSSLSEGEIIQTFYIDVVRGTAHALYPCGWSIHCLQLKEEIGWIKQALNSRFECSNSAVCWLLSGHHHLLE